MPLKFENLGHALHIAYPEISWEFTKFTVVGKKSDQRWLRVKLEELLPSTDIIENYQHPELSWGRLCLSVFIGLILLGNSNRHMELDLWIPRHQIAIEFQGIFGDFGINSSR